MADPMGIAAHLQPSPANSKALLVMLNEMPAHAGPEHEILPKGILILGAAKSGTTALFYAIRNALSAGHGLSIKGLFEPSRANQVESYLREGTDQVPLAKVLLGPLLRKRNSFVEKFEKKVIIYRDPRDNVISRILFMLAKLIAPREKEKIGQVVELFRQKEQAPESISVVHIVREIARITGHDDGLLESVRKNSILPAKMKRETGNVYFMMPYDDLVSRQFDRLSDYLGFKVAGDFEVAEKHAYVVRSKASGAWQDWFLEEDVQFFARDVADEFRILGFDAEAKPKATKEINAKTSSDYVAAGFKRKDKKRLDRMSKRGKGEAGNDRGADRPIVEPRQRQVATGDAGETKEQRRARRAKRRGTQVGV